MTISLKKKESKVFAILIAISLLMLMLYIFFKDKTIYTNNASIDTNIITIKPEVSGYITEVLVEDNSFVKAGQVIAKIDDTDFILNLKKSKAAIESAELKLQAVKLAITQTENELKKLNITLDSAKISLTRSNKDFKRSKALIKEKAISQQQFDKNFEMNKLIQNEYIILKINKNILDVVKKQTMYQSHEADAQLTSLKIASKLLEFELENTLIRSKVDGRVSLKSLQVGQLAFPGISLGHIVEGNVWLIANYKETQIEKVYEGQKAIVSVDAISNKKFKASVKSYSPATGDLFSVLPPENASGNFTKIVRKIPVKIEFDKDQDLSSLRAGFSCEVWLELE